MATELVDASKLDACCTAEANAIRAKTGSSAQITYDWSNSKGFADAIAAIPSGGGASLDDLLAETITAFRVTNPIISNIKTRLSQYKTESTMFCTRSHSGVNSPFTGSFFTSIVDVPPVLSGTGNNYNSSNPYLTICDFGATLNSIGGNAFNGNSNLKTLILRYANIVTCTNTAFTGTPAASGGSGMTIYIPKSLYDHLGDNGSFDYKAATNWSIWDGYSTITWAQIEGSIYETQYADGTPVT